MGTHLDRALFLYEQDRYDQAEDELRQELAAEPNDPMAHALYGLCLVQRGQFEAATAEAHTAVGLAPELAFAHYAHSSILHDRGLMDEAQTAITEALRLDADQPVYHALLAVIHFASGRPAEALDAAERGLRLDPEHLECTNLRAIALVKLGRDEEAVSTIKAALARNPEVALTQANQGWTLLHQNEPEKALEHFREALRLDPELTTAREGIVEALKARHIVYRLLLRVFFWMTRLSVRTQWSLVVGAVLGFGVLFALENAQPALTPFVRPILLLYLLFGMLAWIADPVFNLLLRMDSFGRLALTKHQVTASNAVAACLIPMLLCGLFWLATHERDAFFAAEVFGLLVLPVAGIYDCRPGWPRRAMAIYTCLLALIGFLALVLLVVGSFQSHETHQLVLRMIGYVLLVFYLVGAFFSGWMTIALLAFKAKR